jgi:LPXTG-site transpeptidase (sortase) family protein
VKNLLSKRFLMIWGAATLLIGLGVFWAIYIVLRPGQNDPGTLTLPQVRYTAESKSFIDSLPVLGQSADLGSSAHTPRVLIPRLGLDAHIVELPLKDRSWFIDGLEKNIGHLEGTDAPGGSGNFVLAAHLSLADNSPGPLAHIEQMLPGDQVMVIYQSRIYEYNVTTIQEVAEDRLDVVYPTSTPTLTLLTCARWSWLDGHYTSREVVSATLSSVTDIP